MVMLLRFKRCTVPGYLINKYFRRLINTVPQVSSEGVNIKWSDEGDATAHYHNIWLRHNCHCPHCLADQKTIQPAQLENTRVIQATIEGWLLVLQERIYRTSR